MKFTGLRPRKRRQITASPAVEVLRPVAEDAASKGDDMSNVTVNVHVGAGLQGVPVSVDTGTTHTTDDAARQAAVMMADELAALKDQIANLQAGGVDAVTREALVMLADKVTAIEAQSVKRTELVEAVDGLKVMTPRG